MECDVPHFKEKVNSNQIQSHLLVCYMREITVLWAQEVKMYLPNVLSLLQFRKMIGFEKTRRLQCSQDR